MVTGMATGMEPGDGGEVTGNGDRGQGQGMVTRMESGDGGRVAGNGDRDWRKGMVA